MADIKFVSRYDHRVAFVHDVLQQNSTPDENAARELAVKVVYAMDPIPEPTR